MAVVTLADKDSTNFVIKQPDQMLYDRDINEGDQVKFEGEYLIRI